MSSQIVGHTLISDEELRIFLFSGFLTFLQNWRCLQFNPASALFIFQTLSLLISLAVIPAINFASFLWNAYTNGFRHLPAWTPQYFSQTGFQFLYSHIDTFVSTLVHVSYWGAWEKCCVFLLSFQVILTSRVNHVQRDLHNSEHKQYAA